MASITLRQTKGAALTHTEVDNNFSNINTELGTKVQSVSGTAGRVSVSGTTAPAVDLVSGIATAGSATLASITVDTYGRVTAYSSGTAYTNADTRAAVSAGTGISYNSSTGVISSSITQYTDTNARASLSNGIGISYNSSTGSISLAGDVATAGTYAGQVTVDTYGRVLSASNNITGHTEPIHNIGTTGGTVAPNATNGAVQQITLNSALTINGFTSAVAGQAITLIIYGGTAYTSITSTMKFAGSIKTLTATAGCIDILSIYFDGTT